MTARPAGAARIVAVAVVLQILLACSSPTGRPGGSAAGGDSTNQSSPPRTLVAAVRVEPATLALRTLHPTGVALYLSKGMFNAGVAYLDDKAQPHPYLVEELPQLGTDSWRMTPDGGMETTYHLKANATWHDGQPITADDFVFAWHVYTTPGISEPGAAPWPSIDDVAAPDPRTLVISWNKPYADADTLTARSREFPPLPRHLLEASFERDSMDAFGGSPYWTREYVAAGPFKLDRWEPAAFIEASAFDGHVLGKPKIERMKLLFISDANTALANILAGEVQLAADTVLRLEQTATLKREWRARQLGTILQHPNQWRAAFFQFRPDVQAPRALQDVRIRKALALAIDRQAINDALYDGDAVFGDSMIAPTSEYAPAVERTVVKYPYDLPRSEQLMAEAGYTKVGGFYTSPTDGRLTVEAKTNAATDNESELSILASGWRANGFDVQEAVLPAAQAQDAQTRSTFPGMYVFNTNLGDAGLIGQSSAAMPRPENHWTGANYGGWSNPDYDRLAEQLTATVDRTERGQEVAEMARIFTEDVGAITLFMRTQPWAAVSDLKGMAPVAPESNMTWNIQDWTFR